MTVSQALEKLSVWQKKLAAYGHATSLLSYDGSTTAPKDTAANRAQTLSVLTEEIYRLSTSAETLEFLDVLDAHKEELTPRERRIVELALEDIREMQKIPMDEYVAFEELLVRSDDVWHRAKEENDFASFLPYLEQIFATTRRFATYCAPEMEPYNYCLNRFEKGLTMETCDAFFSALRDEIVPLVDRIGQAKQVSDRCIHGSFSEAEQERFSLELMRIMGIDLGHCGLGTTEHPFTSMLGSHKDVRITTNYKNYSFSPSMFSVIHEGGHALYDMHSDDSLAYTLLDGGVSMGIHESQSRFYENLLGRSRAFVDFLFPKVVECFPRQMEGYTAEDFYRAINLVTPSLIRTEADEVTYSIHVMIRYELEKRVIGGQLEVRDLPAEWNRLYKEYLGVDVPSDTEGVLQDSHWSFGGIGYFPSYALGSAYGAHLLAKMEETVDVEGCLRSGDFGPINRWNEERIWTHGREIPPAELLEKALGEPFDPSYYTEYLKEKYSALYQL